MKIKDEKQKKQVGLIFRSILAGNGHSISSFAKQFNLKSKWVIFNELTKKVSMDLDVVNSWIEKLEPENRIVIENDKIRLI